MQSKDLRSLLGIGAAVVGLSLNGLGQTNDSNSQEFKLLSIRTTLNGRTAIRLEYPIVPQVATATNVVYTTNEDSSISSATNITSSTNWVAGKSDTNSIYTVNWGYDPLGRTNMTNIYSSKRGTGKIIQSTYTIPLTGEGSIFYSGSKMPYTIGSNFRDINEGSK